MLRRFSTCSALFLVVAGVFALHFSPVFAGGPPLQFPWPTGTQQHISGYGYNCTSGHSGADYYAIDFSHYNTTVTAVAAGTVTYAADTQGGLGWLLVINHGGGYTSRYAHLTQNSLLPVGSTVRQGAPIATSGNTGNSEDPHLHFSMRLNGAAYRPEPMSWARGFSAWGVTCAGGASPSWTSKPPANQDFSGDGYADVIGRLASDSSLKLYKGNGSGGWLIPPDPPTIGTGWDGFNWLLGPLGFSADAGPGYYGYYGCIDVSGRRTSDGTWRLYEGNCASGWKSVDLQVTTGFAQYDIIVAPGDWSGDGCADIIARRASDTSLWMYTGNCGTGFTGSPSQIGTNWWPYDKIVGGGDFSGDGCNDIVGRRASDGALRLYRGNCAGGWGATDLSMGYLVSNMNAIWGPGDFNGDRCVDLLTRVASTGNLNLYRGNCAGSFSGVTNNVGTGWGVFNWLW